jgi:hypothetical protein
MASGQRGFIPDIFSNFPKTLPTALHSLASAAVVKYCLTTEDALPVEGI